MNKQQAQALLDRIRNTPARNWRERRQKARVMAAAYRRSKPLPVWDSARLAAAIWATGTMATMLIA